MQEVIIKKQIASDIVPEQIAKMIGKMNKMSAKIVNVLNDMDEVRDGITDFRDGYYAMKPEVPRGVEYEEKKMANKGLEAMVNQEVEREKTEAEKFAIREKERIENMDPQTRKWKAEITKLFLDNI